MTKVINHDQFEPMKLIAVTERLRGWSDGSKDLSLDQLREDVIWLLDSHLYYYQALERAQKALVFRKNGDYEQTWQDRADELEGELTRICSVLELIAAPVRPDGTYNRDRRACELLAKEALGL